MLYSGPLQDTTTGQVYALSPQFAGETVTTSTFYGPNTPIFTPSIGFDKVIAVGSYQYSQSSVLNHGMIYRGSVSGDGTWTQIDVPSSLVGGATVSNTIPHSTMGDLVVGDYDLQGVAASANAFIYNMTTGLTLFNAPRRTNQLDRLRHLAERRRQLVLYIAGGSNNGPASIRHIGQLQLRHRRFSNLRYYTIDDRPVLSHFDGISAVPGGFDMVALGVHRRLQASGQCRRSFSNASGPRLTFPEAR